MRIFVLGGSYFLGRAFVELAAGKHELFVANRGSRPLNRPGVREYCLDRRDGEALAAIEETCFDAVVDFCAYSPGDIRLVCRKLKASFDQYLFVSTCDVYRRGTGRVMGEEDELEERDFGGEAGAYITGKAALERELRESCSEKSAAFTSLRPAFIYGPGNYAPRESLYFHWIATAGQILHPSDADGEFQMAYVEDVARAILAACHNPRAYDRAYNLCGEETTYEDFAIALREAVGTDFVRVELSVSDVLQRGIPLPFPLTAEESQHYSGERAAELGVDYTPLAEGLRKTYLAWLEQEGRGREPG